MNERTKRRGNYDYKGVSPNKWIVLPDQISMHNLKLAPTPPLFYSALLSKKIRGIRGVGEGGLRVEVYGNEMSVMSLRVGGERDLYARWAWPMTLPKKEGSAVGLGFGLGGGEGRCVGGAEVLKEFPNPER